MEEEPERLQSTGLQRVGHDWVTKHSLSWENWALPVLSGGLLYNKSLPNVVALNGNHLFSSRVCGLLSSSIDLGQAQLILAGLPTYLQPAVG